MPACNWCMSKSPTPASSSLDMHRIAVQADSGVSQHSPSPRGAFPELSAPPDSTPGGLRGLQGLSREGSLPYFTATAEAL